MTTPTHDQSIIEMRRARVAQLKLRGLSSREIALALAKGDSNGNGRIVNPSTGEAYNHKVILADLKVLQEEWRKDRLIDTEIHIDRQMAEINEIKRAAWAMQDPKLALEALDREMKLLGTAKPMQFNITFNVEIVQRLMVLVEARGEVFDQWLMEMVQEFESADGEDVPMMVEGVANAYSDTNS